MRIAVISDWFSENMGYAENCLPKALARLGHEVHVVTSNAQVYFNSPTYKETYEPFIGPGVVECGVKRLDGYTLHRLRHGNLGRYLRGGLYIHQLIRTLARIRPQVVQVFDISSVSTYQAALAQPFQRYRLFLESHVHASVFGPDTTQRGIMQRVRRLVIGAMQHLVNNRSIKCYPISVDAARIAVEEYGTDESKIEICSLGVDTDLFGRPQTADAERRRLRATLGFGEAEIVCIYTGRLTPDKGPLYLARAVDSLNQRGLPFRGLFVGSGTAEDIKEIIASAGCVVHPFVPVRDLPPFYWAADIGVWPKQESTSQLDAAACGLPIIISDRTQVPERIDGNGLTYQEGNSEDLAAQIASLADRGMRTTMGERGSQKMIDEFSWLKIARERVEDYEAAL